MQYEFASQERNQLYLKECAVQFVSVAVYMRDAHCQSACQDGYRLRLKESAVQCVDQVRALIYNTILLKLNYYFDCTPDPCSISNGGCPLNQTCSLKQVQCVHPPCPPIVQCTDPCEECTDQQICRLETLPCLIPPCPQFARCLEVCSLPPETGPCRALIKRFFYNSTSGKCERFIYGGCGGNDNNFETLKACESGCKGENTIAHKLTTL